MEKNNRDLKVTSNKSKKNSDFQLDQLDSQLIQ